MAAGRVNQIRSWGTIGGFKPPMIGAVGGGHEPPGGSHGVLHVGGRRIGQLDSFTSELKGVGRVYSSRRGCVHRWVWWIIVDTTGRRLREAGSHWRVRLQLRGDHRQRSSTSHDWGAGARRSHVRIRARQHNGGRTLRHIEECWRPVDRRRLMSRRQLQAAATLDASGRNPPRGSPRPWRQLRQAARLRPQRSRRSYGVSMLGAGVHQPPAVGAVAPPAPHFDRPGTAHGPGGSRLIYPAKARSAEKELPYTGGTGPYPDEETA